MKKNLFLRLSLMMAVLLSTYSCRQDLLPEKETYHNTSEFQLKSSKISLKESKHKAKLLPELQNVEAKFKSFSKTNTQGKTVNYGNGVSIDTESVIYIENGPNFHTYTFNIKRENAQENAPLENLLLVPLPDGKYKEFLITYNLTALEKEKLQAGLFIDTKGKTQVTELESGTFNGGSQLARLVCVTSSYSYWSSCSGSQHHDGSNYASCPIYQGVESGTPPINYTVVTTTCIEPGPAVITPIPTPGEGSGGGPGECPDCPDNTTPQPCIQIPTDPTQPSSGMVDENGCAIGLPTLPNIPIEEPRTDCERLYEKTNDPVLKHKLDSIATLVTQANPDMHETAFVATKQGGVIKYKIFKGTANITANNTKEVEMEINSTGIATGHNHNPNSIPIFAPQYLVVFYKHYKLLHSARENIFVMFNTNFNGTIYAFRMQDVTALDTFFAGLDLDTDAGMEEAEEKVKRIYKNKGKMNERLDYTADMAEKMLMKVLNGSDLGANSVSLYQFEDNIWKKLSSKPNGSIQKIPCP